MQITEHTWETTRTVPWFAIGGGDGPAPTTGIFVLHGLGQRAGPLAARLSSAATADRVLIVPEALARALPAPGAPRAGACWSTGEDAKADLVDNVRYLDGLRAEAERRWGIVRWTVVGFSQGGLTAMRWLSASALRWDRVVLVGSGIPDDVDLARWPHEGSEWILAWGEDDPYATPERIAAMRARIAAAGLSPTLRTFSGGHVLNSDILAQVLP